MIGYKWSKILKNLWDNQHSLNDLGKKQLSIVDSTANILKKTNEEVNNNFNYMNMRIENMTAILQESYYVYKESINFFMVTKQLTSLIEDCRKTQAIIISLLIGISHGRLNINILKPSQLKSEISKIKENLSKTLVLPGKKNWNRVKRDIYSSNS